MNRMCYLSCVCAGVFMLNVAAEAGVVYDNDLDTNTHGITELTNATWDPNSGWIALEDNDPTDKPIVTVAPFDPETTSAITTISWDYQLNKVGNAPHTLFVSGAGATAFLLDMMNPSNQRVRYKDNVGWNVLLDGSTNDTKIQFNIWYNFEITLDPESVVEKSWGLKITRLTDNFVMLDTTGLNFQNDIAEYNAIRWYQNSVPSVANGSKYLIDNLSITTDAPFGPGDFNYDGIVDGRDFLVYQRTWGPEISIGDFKGDWEANYGSTLAENLASVPEPSSMVLCLFCSGLLIGSRRRS